MEMKSLQYPRIPLKVSRADLEAFVLGGAILGGGGGGLIEEGMKLSRFAHRQGFSDILSLSCLPAEALLLTVSAVGAPSAGSGLLEPEDYVRAVELFVERTGLSISGLISSEVGALGVVNGWVQSAALQIPVIDAPANGRAHPLGLMGSMGLHRKKGYVSRQAIVSRSRKKRRRDEAFFSGSIEEVSSAVLARAAASGGMVAVARNPVPVSFVARKGAPGALRMAFRIGTAFLENADPEKRLRSITGFFGRGRVIKAGVLKKTLEQRDGLDVGKIELVSGRRCLELTFWNEYMTLEDGGRRLATFPDLIMTFDAETACPLVSAEIKEGKRVFLIVVPGDRLLLGEGVRDPGLLGRIEEAVGKRVLRPGGLT